jgi:hypothetical protein
MAKERLYEYRKMKSQGAYHYFIKMQGEENWKYHNWDGPAIQPIEGEECSLRKQYFLNGIEYNVESYKEALSNREGLPWYKQAAPKGQTYRN